MKSNYSDWPQKNAKISKKKPATMYFVLILSAILAFFFAANSFLPEFIRVHPWLSMS